MLFNKDQNCLNDRQVIAKKTDGSPVVLYAKRELYDRKKNNLYVSVTCPETICTYTIKFEGVESAKMEPNNAFSYLVTNVNRVILFEVLEQLKNVAF